MVEEYLWMLSEVEQYQIGAPAVWVEVWELPEWEVKKIARGILEGS